MPQRGRPPLDPSDRRTERMQIPMSEAEKAAISEYAEGIGEKPVTWARAVLLKAAQKKAASGERGSRTRTG